MVGKQIYLTRGGFKKFARGEIDICDASRPILKDEMAAAAERGIDFLELPICFDAITVVVNPQNNWVDAITIEDLKKIWEPAAEGKVKQWSDVRPEWPKENLVLYGPGTDSGTFDYFVESVMTPANGDDADAGEAAILESSGTQFSEDDNVLVQGVEGSPYAIGYFGYAYYQENQGSLKALSVNGIEPNAETAESGEYPISRPLFNYSSTEIMQEKPQVSAFIYFYITHVADEILDVGYFPVSEAKAQDNLDTRNAAVGL